MVSFTNTSFTPQWGYASFANGADHFHLWRVKPWYAGVTKEASEDCLQPTPPMSKVRPLPRPGCAVGKAWSFHTV